MKDIHNALRAIRTHRGLSQAAAGKMINVTGQTYGAWEGTENKTLTPHLNNIIKLAAAFNARLIIEPDGSVRFEPAEERSYPVAPLGIVKQMTYERGMRDYIAAVLSYNGADKEFHKMMEQSAVLAGEDPGLEVDLAWSRTQAAIRQHLCEHWPT